MGMQSVRQGYSNNTHSQPAHLPRDTDTCDPRNALGGRRCTQTDTAEAAMHHNPRDIRSSPAPWSRAGTTPGHSTSIPGLFPPRPRGRTGVQSLNRIWGWAAAPWVGWNTNLTFPGLGPRPGTPPDSGLESLCPRPVGHSRSSTSEGEGPPPQEQRPCLSLLAGRSTSTRVSACSGLQPPDFQRQAPRGGHHQVALSTDLGRDMKTQGSSGHPAGHAG